MDPLNLTETKQFALKTLACFDDLAKPEIKNRVMLKIWDYIKNYTFKTILKKPDDELKTKLYEVYKVLGPMFKDTEMSAQIKMGESMGSPKIPDVGELAKIKRLAPSDSDLELLKELNL